MTKEFILKRKLLIGLLIGLVLSFIMGVLFISILGKDNGLLVKTSVNSYFEGINLGNINYLNGFSTIFFNRLLLLIIIWIMGISIIGIFIVIAILLFKSFLIGFSLSSIIYTFGLKGILVGCIYMIPEIISLFIIFLLSYYSINFSIMLFNYLFRKKEISRVLVVRRYLKLLIICIGLFLCLSLIDVFVIPNFLRLF